MPRTASGELAAISRASAVRRLVDRHGVAAADVVHEPDLGGARRVDVLAGVGELGDVARPDDPRQPLERPHVRDDGDLGLAHREHRVARAQADVARGDEVHGAADAVAVHRGDHRDGEVGDRAHRRLPVADPVVARGVGRGGRGALARRQRRELLEVEPDAEVRPARGDDEGAHVVASGDLGGRHAKVAPEGPAHRVARLGPVQPQRRDVVVDLQGEYVGREHWPPLRRAQPRSRGEPAPASRYTSIATRTYAVLRRLRRFPHRVTTRRRRPSRGVGGLRRAGSAHGERRGLALRPAG